MRKSTNRVVGRKSSVYCSLRHQYQVLAGFIFLDPFADLLDVGLHVAAEIVETLVWQVSTSPVPACDI